MQNYSKVFLVLLYKYAEARKVKNSVVIALQTYIKTYGRKRRVLNNTYACLLLLDTPIYQRYELIQKSILRLLLTPG